MKNSCLAVLGLMIAAAPGAALAHVGLEPRQAAAAATVKATLLIGHGCQGSPTREIRVKVPEGMVLVKPMPKPGWQLETVSGKLAKPVDNHGTLVTEGVQEIRWRGGSLPDDQFDEFAFRGRLPDAPGQVLYIPVVQICDQGEHRWIEIPDEGRRPDELNEPAPALRLIDRAG